MEVLSVVLIPFLGTVIGSASVFFLRGQMGRHLQQEPQLPAPMTLKSSETMEMDFSRSGT